MLLAFTTAAAQSGDTSLPRKSRCPDPTWQGNGTMCFRQSTWEHPVSHPGSSSPRRSLQVQHPFHACLRILHCAAAPHLPLVLPSHVPWGVTEGRAGPASNGGARRGPSARGANNGGSAGWARRASRAVEAAALSARRRPPSRPNSTCCLWQRAGREGEAAEAGCAAGRRALPPAQMGSPQSHSFPRPPVYLQTAGFSRDVPCGCSQAYQRRVSGRAALAAVHRPEAPQSAPTPLPTPYLQADVFHGAAQRRVVV